MKRLITKAKRKEGKTNPNPMTAAAVYKGEEIIAFGVHDHAGGKHAERLALEKAGKLAIGASLMVNLEPCTHHGKTPPCVDAIIASGIRHVIYAMKDPNPDVRKKPAKAVLEAAGIRVQTGCCQALAVQLNERFIKNCKHRLPWVILKAAVSLDGKIAVDSGESSYITGEEARKSVHRLRRVVDAILVGSGTVKADNPSLNVRFSYLTKGYKNPDKVILDPKAELSAKSKLFKDKSSKIFLVRKENSNHDDFPNNVEIIVQKNHSWPQLLKTLFKHGISSVLIEGGTAVFSSALDAGIVDKVSLYQAPLFLGGQGAYLVYKGKKSRQLSESLKLDDVTLRRLGDDVLIEGKIL